MDGVETAPVVVHRILIEQQLTPDGDIVDWVVSVAVGDQDENTPVPLGTALGMLRLAEDTLIRDAMDED